MAYEIKYSCNFGCYEFIDNWEIETLYDLEEAVQHFKNLSENINDLDLSVADSEICSWHIHAGDISYGEFYGGYIRLFDDDRLLLYASYDREIEVSARSYEMEISKKDEDNEDEEDEEGEIIPVSTYCGIEIGEDADEDEIALFRQMGIAGDSQS